MKQVKNNLSSAYLVKDNILYGSERPPAKQVASYKPPIGGPKNQTTFAPKEDRGIAHSTSALRTGTPPPKEVAFFWSKKFAVDIH